MTAPLLAAAPPPRALRTLDYRWRWWWYYSERRYSWAYKRRAIVGREVRQKDVKR